MSRKYLEYKAGLGNVGSYQASAKPYLSSSIHVPTGGGVVKIEFPNVTRFLTIANIGPVDSDDVAMRVGFSINGVNDLEHCNYFLLENGESYSGDWRVSELYLRTDTGSTNATGSVIAGLTNIAATELSHNWTGSVGVG